MSPLFSSPCACREERIPYGSNVVLDAVSGVHRSSRPDPDALLAEHDCGCEVAS